MGIKPTICQKSKGPKTIANENDTQDMFGSYLRNTRWIGDDEFI